MLAGSPRRIVDSPRRAFRKMPVLPLPGSLSTGAKRRSALPALRRWLPQVRDAPTISRVAEKRVDFFAERC
jgi:hypothetical protein